MKRKSELQKSNVKKIKNEETINSISLVLTILMILLLFMMLFLFANIGKEFLILMFFGKI